MEEMLSLIHICNVITVGLRPGLFKLINHLHFVAGDIRPVSYTHLFQKIVAFIEKFKDIGGQI